MAKIKDKLASLIAYIFTQDQKENPLPEDAKEKIQNHLNEKDNQKK